MRTALLPLAILGSAALLVSGCSGDSGTTTTSNKADVNDKTKSASEKATKSETKEADKKSDKDDDKKSDSKDVASKDTLVVAGVPSENSQGIKTQFETLGKLITKETGKKIKFQTATDYAAVIEGQRAGKVDIAMYGPFSYTIAKDSGVNLEPLGAIAKSKDVDPGYYSIGWVKKGSDIKKIEDFKGKKICFVDVNSTSGYLYPSAGLLAAKIDPKKDVKPQMAGGHDASLLAIRSGQCDAGFAYEAMETTLKKKGSIKDGDVKEVWRSELIAGSPIAVNADTVDAATVAKLKKLISTKANIPSLVEDGICDDKDNCALPEDTKYGFKKASDSDYDGVRKVCELTKADSCKS